MTEGSRPPGGDNNINEQSEVPQQGKEPEGGPFARELAFLEERFATLEPKPLEGSIVEPRPPVSSPEEELDRLRASSTLPADFRRNLVEQYRQRQRQKLAAEGISTGEEGEGRADTEEPVEEEPEPPPPTPPAPPPANNWIPIGPSVLRQGQGGVKPATSGRTPAIAVAPGGTRIYIGAANGGVWYSEDTGQTWRSLMDAFDLNPTQTASDSLACGAIALVPGTTSSQDRLYVGSGEGAGGAYFGVGPLISTDGGINWSTESANPDLAGSAFYALAVDPGDAERVIAATRRGVYRREPNSSGGVHWMRKTLPSAGSTWATSVVVARSGGITTFYTAVWYGPVYSSTDGDTWNSVGSSFPTANVGRIGLAVQPNNPNVLYALIENSSDRSILGVWRLDISDNTWRQISGYPTDLFGTAAIGFQGSYDLAIAVDPNNANRLYLGGSTKQSSGEWSGSLYRSVVTSSGSGASLTYSMSNTYIGGSVHADIHTLVFAPGDSDKLWVGCDGGVFYSTTPTTGTGNIFTSCNTGLATLTMEHLDQHPTEDAVVFCGSQDNGGERFTGEEVWLHSVWGDSGFFVVNWNAPYKILSTYVRSSINRSIDGGTRYNYNEVGVTLASGETVLFYAPIAGTPHNPSNPSEADIVAFGSIRPWISTTFGGGWQSIPNNTLAGDSLNERIRSLAFASATKLYAGTMSGGVYRFEQSGGTWTRTQINTLGGTSSLPLTVPVTDIAIDLADATGNSIYITFGGIGDYRHVWHFDGTQWQQRSGPAAGNPNSLLAVQANAIVVDPANTSHIYVGADIGIWRSTDGGANWSTFSEGLPDAAVIDMKLHADRRLLRASTHGRGVFERTLDALPKLGIELYVRDTQLDQGRFPTVNYLPDPTQQGEVVRFWRGPDIKLDTPDASGQYQFPLTGTIDLLQFVDTLTDDFQNVATHATATITTRVYVQVHNRGVIPADNVRVMLLIANASAGLPALPANYWVDVQNGTAIDTADWKTVGITTLNGVRVGFPKIAAFNLTSDKLPPPASLAGNHHHCVLALVHHVDDPYTSIETHTDTNSRLERKAAHKNLTVVEFVGTLPTPPPIIVPVRIHNAYLNKELTTNLTIDLKGFPGRLRLFIPPLRTAGRLADLVQGMRVESTIPPFPNEPVYQSLEETKVTPWQSFQRAITTWLRVLSGQSISTPISDFQSWATLQSKVLTSNLASQHAYNPLWVEQRLEDIRQAIGSGVMLTATDRQQIALHRIVMEPNSYHTIFLAIDRPEDTEVGQFFELDILQIDERREEILGGLTTRVALVPDPEPELYTLKLSSRRCWAGGTVIQAQFFNLDGQLMTPNDGVTVRLMLRNASNPVRRLEDMRYDMASRSFRYYLCKRTKTEEKIGAIAFVNSSKVAEAQLS
ncbi:PQQ-binding-like beta-propeller repeat protein [Pseudanabaena sp. PCC 6802]|uniref:PQQ-binding-like beta-propeller repeat protein n=1 Tax=Pseudanabaena sp. PCC 6802 TaxID=118173 RepID=UPI000349892B|nr:PQQ-binding-like beta-propeller repeat protein [Pseudanabaena sp. PCC 6802]